MAAIDTRAGKPKPTGIFRFKVSVYVTIKQGEVAKVSVDDEADLSNPELVEGTDLSGMVEAALDARSWPTWEFGWTPAGDDH